jgi:hypothetical protein
MGKSVRKNDYVDLNSENNNPEINKLRKEYERARGSKRNFLFQKLKKKVDDSKHETTNNLKKTEKRRRE